MENLIYYIRRTFKATPKRVVIKSTWLNGRERLNAPAKLAYS